jgi:hypothetical protein
MPVRRGRDGPVSSLRWAVLSRIAPAATPWHPRACPAVDAPPLANDALELLAACSDVGCSEAILLAHGFSVAMMVRLVRTGLATATSERVVAGGKTMEVATLRITDAGRRVLVKQ